jgi:hypothetical protein
MEQVVLKPHNLLEQLRILANDVPVQHGSSISNLFNQAYQDDPLARNILAAIRRKCTLKEIMVVECTELDGKMRY